MQCRYTNLRHSHYGSANLQTASSPPSSPSLPPPQQTESESTSYHWMREMNTSAHTIILRENAGFKSAVLPRLVGFEGIISFSLPPNPVFSPFLLVADGSVPCFNFFFFFFGSGSPPSLPGPVSGMIHCSQLRELICRGAEIRSAQALCRYNQKTSAQAAGSSFPIQGNNIIGRKEQKKHTHT